MRLSCLSLAAVSALAAGLLSPVALAEAGVYRQGSMAVVQPWSHPAQAGNDASAFAILRNSAMTTERLVSASCECAERIDIVRLVQTDQGPVYDPLAAGPAMPPGGAMLLTPDGLQLRLMRLKLSQVESTEVQITLVFERAGTITVPFEVRPATPTVAPAP